MDNQVNNSSRATFVLVVILILLGALAVLWYSGHLPGVVGPAVSNNAADEAAQQRQRMVDSLPKVEESESASANRQMLTRSLNKVKVDTSTSAAARREAMLNALPPVK